LAAWFNGVKPDSTGKVDGTNSSVIIGVDHSDQGYYDAFYFFFYAYNLGNAVFDIVKYLEFGDHVGDWENVMVRFNTTTEQPTMLFYSQHANGEAFTYDAVEKQGDRPVGYSATGTHATYATTGIHDHTIPNLNSPFGPLEDKCDQGTLWDPTLAALYYTYDPVAGTFAAADDAGANPVGFLNFKGQWGDDQIPSGQRGQVILFGEAKYASGPTGPEDKGLNRTADRVCPGTDDCIVRTVLMP
jgi:Vacuolar protein sorting-associated protein 62